MRMQSIISDLKDREYSIDRLLAHVYELSETRGKIDVIVVIKSSVFIALYNNIEATIYSVFERLHNKISHLTYDELIPPLQKKMILYSFGKTAGAHMQDPHKVASEAEKLKREMAKFPELSEYLRRQTIFSGNIDARKLNEIGSSYGMPPTSFHAENANRMLWVKNKRNKIAHGEQSMSDGGKGIKNSDLDDTCKSVSAILRSFIASAEIYLKSDSFRQNNEKIIDAASNI